MLSELIVLSSIKQLPEVFTSRKGTKESSFLNTYHISTSSPLLQLCSCYFLCQKPNSYPNAIIICPKSTCTILSSSHGPPSWSIYLYKKEWDLSYLHSPLRWFKSTLFYRCSLNTISVSHIEFNASLFWTISNIYIKCFTFIITNSKN